MLDRRNQEEREPMPFRPHVLEWDDARVTRFWDFYASNSDIEYFSGKFAGSIAAALVRAVHPLGSVLDVGCGVGHLVGELLHRGIDARGIDSSSESITEARRRLGRDDAALTGSMTSLPVADSTVDTVAMIEVIEHVLDQDLRLLFREVHRVLRPGGHVFLTTPNAEDLAVQAIQCPDCGASFHRMQHVRSWSASSLAATLQDHGFEGSRMIETRFMEPVSPPERVLRSLWYRMTRDRPHLIAVASRR